MMISNLRIRTATPSDGPILFEWVNRPDSLAGKLETTEPIPRSVHDKWFSARLSDPETLILIAEVERRAVGQVRLQRDGGKYVIDVYVTPENRGHGVSDKLIDAAITQVSSVTPETRVVANVKPDNTASAALFERSGFTEVSRTQKCRRFERSTQT
ncbi:MAG: GNAT family N-acetyltransferase [Rhodospirillales bacterium]